MHLRYRRAALAFMQWQVRRGLLAPLAGPHPGSPWWRAVNERLLHDTCEARMRVIGHPGPSSSASTQASVRFAFRPSVRAWYLAHNVTIVRGYLDNRELAEGENRVERFFMNLVLARLLYARALVAAPRLALSWLSPVAPWLGDPRRAMTGMFLSLARVLPNSYPLGRIRPTTRDRIAIARRRSVAAPASPSVIADPRPPPRPPHADSAVPAAPALPPTRGRHRRLAGPAGIARRRPAAPPGRRR